MKLSLENGELCLPEDFVFEITSNHPFFSDEGTSSVPVTIPSSPENLELLGRPENIHAAKRFVTQRLAMLKSGAFEKRCRMIMESAGAFSGISASLALHESELYAELQDKKLKDIFVAKSYIPTKNDVVKPWDLYQGEDRYTGYLKEFAIFPVASDMEGNGEVLIINEPMSDRFRDEARTVTVNGKSISVPAGYGITPFMYLWALIEYTFTLSGYQIDDNVFKTDIELQNLVVVNNCADSGIYVMGSTWGFNYSDLVPDMTVGELITFLHDVFGAIVAHDTGRISIRLFRDIVAGTPDMDLSPYSRAEADVAYPEAKILERKFDTSLESAAPAAETLTDFRASHESLATIDTEDQIAGTGAFYVSSLGKYYYKAAGQSDKTMLGTDCFTYSRDIGLEPESISTDNLYLPMARAGGRYMPYIGKRIHRHIDVDDRDSDASQPMQLCYAHYWEKYNSQGILEQHHYCGSSYSHYEDGTKATYTVREGQAILKKSYSALTPEGLNGFWRGYESMVVNAAPEVNVVMDMPLEVLLTMDRHSLKLYHNALVLIKSMSYTIGDSGILSVNAVLQLCPYYYDAVQLPEIIFSTSYVWKIRNEMNLKEYNYENRYLKIIHRDTLQDYTMNDAPKEKPYKIGQIAKERTRSLIYEIGEFYDYYEGVVIRKEYTYSWKEYFISEFQES